MVFVGQLAVLRSRVSLVLISGGVTDRPQSRALKRTMVSDVYPISSASTGSKASMSATAVPQSLPCFSRPLTS